MKDFHYVIRNFFTHKDFLAPAEQIPGTIFTPLNFAFEIVLLLIIVSSAIYVSRRKHLIKPVFTGLWLFLVAFEMVIVAWDSTAGSVVGLDLKTDLSLYPCSIFLYVMPFVIWGKGICKRMACGYVCTLGILGAMVNFLYPVARLTDYSCISFPGFHTFIYHGTMMFTFFVMLFSGFHRYRGVTRWWELFLPCVPSLLLSIPANLVNYSSINADYMYFRGQFPLLQQIFAGFRPVQITAILYVLYILVPALFYLPSYMAHLREERGWEPIGDMLLSRLPLGR